jgi:hypothetical protein
MFAPSTTPRELLNEIRPAWISVMSRMMVTDDESSKVVATAPGADSGEPVPG